MVKLTNALVARKLTKKSGQRTDNDTDALRKLTHLHLQGSFIDTIVDISQCKNLTVLYLQNNCLINTDNLEHAHQLTHLYLQNNKIRKIENLNGLRKLKKLHSVIHEPHTVCWNCHDVLTVPPTLRTSDTMAMLMDSTLNFWRYLGWNYITVIEGLDKLRNLEELHIQNQQLPQGETIHFDPRTMEGLSKCLHILDVTANGLTSLADLKCLRELQWLIAQHNCLTDMTDLSQAVSLWDHLTNLELQGNPACSHRKYRESLITCSSKLVSLDGKEIHEITREFLRRLEISKERRKMASHEIPANPTLSADITDLTKNFTPGVTKSVIHSIYHEAELEAISGDYKMKSTANFMFPAWKEYKL